MEYLGQLISHHKKVGYEKTITIGDVVLIVKENVKHIEWPLGRITETITGKDGIWNPLESNTKPLSVGNYRSNITCYYVQQK